MDSQKSELQKPLGDMQLGAKKLSILLNEIQHLGDMLCSKQGLKKFQLQKLPITIQSRLTMSSDTLEELAMIVAKIVEIDQQTIAISSVSDSTAETLKF